MRRVAAEPEEFSTCLAQEGEELILNFDIHLRGAMRDPECRLIVAGWGKKCRRVVRHAEALDGKADPVFVEFPVAIFIVVGRGGVDAGFREDHAELHGSLVRSEALLEDFLSLDEKVFGLVPVQDEHHVAPVVTKAVDAYVDSGRSSVASPLTRRDLGVRSRGEREQNGQAETEQGGFHEGHTHSILLEPPPERNSFLFRPPSQEATAVTGATPAEWA
jgi:hypothetical protein